MTPKRIAELQEIFTGDFGRDALEWIGGEEVRDLLATAEREAKLRTDIVVVANNLAMLLATRISPEDGLIADIHKDLRAALEQKGGES